MISRRRDLEIDLGYLRDNVVHAVEQGNTGVVTDGLAAYEELVLSFMEVVGKFSDPVAGVQALANDALNWEELRWVNEAFVDISDAAFHGTRRGIRMKVMAFPIDVAYRAWEARDVAVFTLAMYWTRLCYSRAVEAESPGAVIRREAVDYIGLRLHDLLSYAILGTLERESREDEIALQAAFAEQVVLAFNGLLKECYDERLLDDFGAYSRQLYDVIQPGYDRYEFVHPYYEEQLTEAQEAIVGLIRFIEVMSIGLDAWILRDVLAETRDGSPEKIDVRLARGFRSHLMIPDQPSQIWDLYLRTSQREYDRQLGWSWWELEGQPPRRTYVGMDFSWLVLRDVLLRMMEITATWSQDAVNSIRLGEPENVEYVFGDGGPVNSQLNELVERSDRLHALVDFDVPESAAKLRPLFDLLRSQAEAERNERVKAAPLSRARVIRMRDDILKGWRESSYLREVFQRFGAYRFSETDPPDVSPLSIYRLDPKEWYVEPTNVVIDRLGVDYGRAMVVGEDRLVAGRLFATLTRPSQQPIEGSQVVAAVTQALETVDVADAVIITVGSSPALWELRKSPDFEWQSKARSGAGAEPSGLFQGHAVYQLHEAHEAFIVIADLRRTGIWHQYKPDVPEGAELLADTLLFELDAFNVESAEAFLVEAPETYLFDQQRQRDRSHEEQLDLLLQSVRFRILEKLRYEVREPDAGRVLEVTSRTSGNQRETQAAS
jgi:hypothetical protein